MDNKSKIYVTEEGYNQYLKALEESEIRLNDKMRERTESGKK